MKLVRAARVPARVSGPVQFCPLALAAAMLPVAMLAQAPATPDSPAAPASQAGDYGPIAIVPLDTAHPDRAAKVTGALEVTQGKAIIAASGEVTSGTDTINVALPHRGTLRVCASTTVKLSADNGVPSGEVPGLMMAMDHGAVEASFATGRNADILLTPDFRILIGGPGAVEVKVRLGDHGDTCIDNPGADAPYVLVTSVFDGGAYRVQAGQRVMFQHGSLREVVDSEKEPCGCPPAQPAAPLGNAFPLAQSEGLAPLPKLPSSAGPTVGLAAQPTPPLLHNASENPQTADVSQIPAPPPVTTATPAPAVAKPAPEKKPGFLHRVGSFFRRIFGAE